eukprot:10185661-Prorocentrum_lima.AAC.1
MVTHPEEDEGPLPDRQADFVEGQLYYHRSSSTSSSKSQLWLDQGRLKEGAQGDPSQLKPLPEYEPP